MIIETLKKFGLSDNESKIYILLLEEGPLVAGKISAKSSIHRRTVYDTINSLINYGLVNYSIKENKKLFDASDPQKLVQMIDNTKKEITNILPILKQKQNQVINVSEARIYTGRKGIISILEDILRYNEILTFGSHGRSKEILGPYFELHHKKRRRNEIKSKFLLSERLRSSDILDSLFAEIRYLDKSYDSKIATIITEEKVLIIIWNDDPIGVVIESHDVCHAFRNYFNIIWNIAKE